MFTYKITKLFVENRISFISKHLRLHCERKNITPAPSNLVIALIKKTRTKVVHKNVSQGCNFVKRSENFLKSRDIKVASCDL